MFKELLGSAKILASEKNCAGTFECALKILEYVFYVIIRSPCFDFKRKYSIFCSEFWNLDYGQSYRPRCQHYENIKDFNNYQQISMTFLDIQNYFLFLVNRWLSLSWINEYFAIVRKNCWLPCAYISRAILLAVIFIWFAMWKLS